MDSGNSTVLQEVCKALTRVVRGLDATFRDRVLFAKLRRAADVNVQLADEALANALFLAYRAFLDCAPPRDVLVTEVGPALEVLKLQLSDPAYLASVTTALATIANVAAAPAAGGAPASSSSSAAAPAADAVASESPPPPSPTPVRQEDGPAMQKARSLLERFRIGKSAAAAPPPSPEEK